MVNLHPKVCNLCGGKVIYTPNSDIYGKRYGSGYCYRCTACKAYVGTHCQRPKQAFGILSNPKMRAAKQKCHNLFDSFWMKKKNASYKRQKAYETLAERLNINKSECHFGYFDLEMLDKAYIVLLEMQKQE